MKKFVVILSCLVTVTSIAFTACQDSGARSVEPEIISKDSLIKRGDYLVTTMLCDDCHSPKKMGPHGPEVDAEFRLSGFRQNSQLPPVDTSIIAKGWIMFNQELTSSIGPWGASFSANLTSDETGIGNWSEEQFFKAIRHGKLKGLDESRPLLPPMPWQNIRQLKDEDLRAVFAYLKSTKPVENRVPGPKLLSELK